MLFVVIDVDVDVDVVVVVVVVRSNPSNLEKKTENRKQKTPQKTIDRSNRKPSGTTSFKKKTSLKSKRAGTPTGRDPKHIKFTTNTASQQKPKTKGAILVCTPPTPGVFLDGERARRTTPHPQKGQYESRSPIQIANINEPAVEIERKYYI